MKSRTLPVVLQKCDSYTPSVIAELIDRIVPCVGLNSSLHGKKVLLKPNLISSIGPRLACTHGGFIAGAAMWFQAHGAKVLVGDSPAFGSAVKVCQTQKIFAALHGLNVRVVNFVSPVAVKLSGGVSVTVAREALECDLFVGLPKIKAHNQMYVTMAVKNIFGTVKGVNKAMLHMVHGNSHDQFASIILDLMSILPPQLHLADAIEVMHKSGPLDGAAWHFTASPGRVALWHWILLCLIFFNSLEITVLSGEQLLCAAWTAANSTNCVFLCLHLRIFMVPGLLLPILCMVSDLIRCGFYKT